MSAPPPPYPAEGFNPQANQPYPNKGGPLPVGFAPPNQHEQYPQPTVGAPPAYGPAGLQTQTMGFSTPYGGNFTTIQSASSSCPQYSSHANAVIVQPIATVIAQQYRDNPVRTICPFCSADILTSIQYDSGTFTWLVAGVVCFFGCNAGCCLIPFCVDGCKDVVHSCPNCQQQISRWSRL